MQHCVEDGYRQWISLEEHHQVGGLGSTLLEWLRIKILRQFNSVGWVSEIIFCTSLVVKIMYVRPRLECTRDCRYSASPMILLGLDFDNTLVSYDNLFHQLASKKA